MDLRPYQHEALQRSKAKYAEGVTRQLIALPTGTGKTVIFASISQYFPDAGRTLVLVHREELAEQAADKLRRCNPGLSVGIEMAERHASSNDRIVVGSVQTLGRKGSKRLAALDPAHFTKIICDEAHHSIAQSYLTVFDHFGLRSPDNKKLLLGVTATPNRSDGSALGQVYDEIIYQMPILQAIRQGWLTDVTGYKISGQANLDDVHTLGGDFKQDELSGAVNTPYRNSLVVKGWLDNAKDRQTVAFTVDIQHAKDLATAFQERGVTALAVWGDDPDRADKLTAHRAGHIKVLCNCAVLTEGYDDWRIACVLMAKPTKSQLLFVQMCGRGLRIPEGIDNLLDAKARGLVVKEDCVLLDVVDNTNKHSLVTLASVFGLGAKTDLNGRTVTHAVKVFNEVQLQHPNVDLSKAPDLDKLEAFVQQVDLFDIKFAAEVIAYSKLQWFKAADGSYNIYLPDKETIKVYRDQLDKWAILGDVKGNHIDSGQWGSIDQAFGFADEMINLYAKEYVTLLRRDATWHREPATAPQIGLLKRFKMPIKEGMTRREAQNAISKYMRRPFFGKAEGVWRARLRLATADPRTSSWLYESSD